MSDNSERNRIKQLFYSDKLSDAKFVFEDGETIQCSRAILAYNCEVFERMFFGDLAEGEEQDIIVKGCDSAAFKHFLECLIGIIDTLTMELALEIFLLAHKYQVRKLQDKCVTVFMSARQMGEDICTLLNISLLCDVTEVTEHAIQVIETHSVARLLLEEDYCEILSPQSVVELITSSLCTAVEKELVLPIFRWAKRYTQLHQIEDNLRQFLSGQGIWDRISIACFEDPGEFMALCKSEFMKGVYSEHEITSHLEKICVNNPASPIKKWEWVEVRPGQKLRERFTLIVDFTKEQRHHYARIEIAMVPFYCYLWRSLRYDFKSVTVRLKTTPTYIPKGSVANEDVYEFNSESRLIKHNPTFVFNHGAIHDYFITTVDILYQIRASGAIMKSSPDFLHQVRLGESDELFFTKSINVTYNN